MSRVRFTGSGLGLLLAVGAFLAWGTLSPGNEILLRQVTPLWMQAVRGVLAATIVLAIFGPRRIVPAWRLLTTPRILFALFWGGVASFTLFSFAQTRIPAEYTTLGFYTSPLWTGLFAKLLLRERLGASFVPAAAGLLAGGWLALAGGSLRPDGFGMLLAIGSGVTWGLYAVFLRRDASHVDWRDLLLAATVLAAGVFSVLAVVLEPLPHIADWTATTWRWTLIQALVPTVVALGLYQAALQRAPAASVNLLVGLELASTLLFAALLFGNRLAPMQLVGVVVVLAAVTAHLWWQDRTGSPPESSTA